MTSLSSLSPSEVNSHLRTCGAAGVAYALSSAALARSSCAQLDAMPADSYAAHLTDSLNEDPETPALSGGCERAVSRNSTMVSQTACESLGAAAAAAAAAMAAGYGSAPGDAAEACGAAGPRAGAGAEGGADLLMKGAKVMAFRSSYDELGFNNLKRDLGENICAAMRDPMVNEIMLNSDGSLFVEHRLEGMKLIDHINSARGNFIIRTVASIADRQIDPACPVVSVEIPYDGSRFEGLLPPLVRSPVFSIRCHNSLDLTLDDLTAMQVVSPEQSELLREAIAAHVSIMVAGATGSGKTTLVNALLNEMSTMYPDERMITIEDTPELKIRSANSVSLFTSEGTDMSRLVRSSLRLRPDRIVVGEIRGAEALDLIDAFSTGHRGGMCTIHAGSPLQAMERLNLLISRHPSCPALIEPTAAAAIELIVQVTRSPHRYVKSLTMVTGCHNGQYELTEVTDSLTYALQKRSESVNKSTDY
ncbi:MULTISPECIES: P-type conjugative transfer ATPase TrbB [unclassified Anaerobiospirillum]|uniref:P-type conjugative transfer ATPase TrbB n=1 Tax=unclassified Anaerobiospirillum TaxID=2647410 RepID=UPI001FF3EE91|nr:MULTISPECIES: P-type conjugative transfer ATPase TrbB [unclassified Anaerobiospirillum]MCK0535526.1 P-type conjugative transfer ATPase TrbB [Anaerobiospirillum sp. NML120511]MCK0540722.1 P-type conjugative transfer ATPase TrbB [Anaerobiospirillum sp. NML02-A-032]